MEPVQHGGILGLWAWLTAHLRGAGEVVPRLVMRLVMGWEFWESGLEKYHGENWFTDVQGNFPFPFSVIPADLSWGIATWFELIGAVLLWLGLATRFTAFSLLVLTFVATAAVHWPDMITMWGDLLKGYAVSDHGYGNFKLPLLFAVMLLPLIFNGAGRFSLDYLASRALKLEMPAPGVSDLWSASLAALILGIPMTMLVWPFGVALLVISLAAAALAVWHPETRPGFLKARSV